MNKNIRLTLLVVIIFIAGISAYNFVTKFQPANLPIKVKITDNGVDVEIENFRIEHQVLGRNDWNLKAELALVDQDNKITRLTNVEVILDPEMDQPSWISAKSGIMNHETQDIELEGDVKFVASVEGLQNRFRASSPKSAP